MHGKLTRLVALAACLAVAVALPTIVAPTLTTYGMTRITPSTQAQPSTIYVPPVSTAAPPSASERECGCTRNKIWLDIVAIIDNSKSMTQEGISQVQANLDTIAHQLTISQTQGWASRLALVTYASTANVVANLTTFSNFDDIENSIFNINVQNNDDKVNILDGLKAANGLFQKSPVSPQRRQVVIVYASAYSNAGFGDPLPMAHQMMGDNVKLITVAFAQRMESQDVLKVAELAYPGFNLTNDQMNLEDALFDSLCQANCFCSGNWLQYRADYANDQSRGYGICLRYAGINAGWSPASHGCRSEIKNGYLVTEFTKHKHDFNVAFAQNQTVNGDSDYHIGLQYKNGHYQWEQMNISSPVALSSSYQFWNPGYPNTAIGSCVKAAKLIGNKVGWTNEDCWSSKRYICQVNTCDTDNYCDGTE